LEQSFLLVTYALATITAPLLLALVLRPLSLNTFNYLPAGPTPIIFAVLAQYYTAIPHIYKYRVGALSTSTSSSLLLFSNKSYTYLPALQLALSQLPGSLLCAAVGWVIGQSWRNELLPGAMMRWRVPHWLVGMRPRERAEEFEGLRRRLAGQESNPILATGSAGREGAEAGRRRTYGRQLLDQFRGAF
jgi:hypothetical protein